MLEGVHRVDSSQVRGRRVLLFDDLYRSGATMNVICASLYDSGCAESVFALTVTKSRNKQ
jgi:predicted amidophosphoribosyltransferase